VKEASNKSSI